jgi:hypothetical protein
VKTVSQAAGLHREEACDGIFLKVRGNAHDRGPADRNTAGDLETPQSTACEDHESPRERC